MCSHIINKSLFLFFLHCVSNNSKHILNNNISNYQHNVKLWIGYQQQRPYQVRNWTSQKHHLIQYRSMYNNSNSNNNPKWHRHSRTISTIYQRISIYNKWTVSSCNRDIIKSHSNIAQAPTRDVKQISEVICVIWAQFFWQLHLLI